MKNNARIAVIQGSVIEIRASANRQYPQAGGGKRQPQRGHNARLAKRMEKDLLKCKAPGVIVWLTYPDIRGPEKVKKHIVSFIVKLEKRLRRKLATVAKLETQERLSPEVALLIWGATEKEVHKLNIAKLWAATIDCDGEVRVRIEPIGDWNRLASYVSKQVAVTKNGVFVGHKRFPSSLSKEHKTTVPDIPRSQHENELYQRVLSEWQAYEGRFHWKHRDKDIPRHRRIVMTIREAGVDKLRHAVNRHRKNHFVGHAQGFSLCGTTLAGIDLSAILGSSRVITSQCVSSSIYQCTDMSFNHPIPTIRIDHSDEPTQRSISLPVGGFIHPSVSFEVNCQHFELHYAADTHWPYLTITTPVAA